jgi:SnoaL-like polyketide cyclase/PDZ domain
MEDHNILIIREFLEQIINRKNFDRFNDYFSPSCLVHNTPYVGMGVMLDDSSGDRLVIRQVAAHAPASGKLMPGDVIIAAKDGERTWQGFDQLSQGMWGFGILGTSVTLTLQRDGQTREVTIQRGLVQEFDVPREDFLAAWQHFYTSEMPDLHIVIDWIFASGDQVAYYATNTATHVKYKTSAVWSECNIMRLEGGKIVEWWGVDDALSMYRQFGFRLVEPGKA